MLDLRRSDPSTATDRKLRGDATELPNGRESSEAKPSRLVRITAPVFHRFLDRLDAGLERGAIDAHLPDGTHRLLGGRADGPVPVVTLHRWRALVRLGLLGLAAPSTTGYWTDS